uniref:Uncharacterized protein n=1 Tax=Chaetoceros debilis TaxID=122233 RepID=A0A7S3QJK5_9STRA|mmetsp:Transcript_13926/g.20786  ORF Transcript_13926/g.20786 Transcript_13926/m.20786 type:complete len:112 (+) Transcript_13926:60-395(+)|eukprot:CAMPEP_0194120184 /NCGR_PEP_ID=MMETSP0150-20130528/42495_1 /TAXON_ID=122233 /ORGANISM="Chaetoceros debilis, Strain MM31A-1" /LENGTH=111 /DNA_ID=CAMNT_0038812199 /DNA_START=41 /DNA_END=376 /DNA_ORIENTATION=+
MVYVYIVFHQQETWHGSVYSGDGRHYDDPENLNKKCIGVYNNDRDANYAALEHIMETLGLYPDEDENTPDDIDDYSDDVLADFFWDAMKHDGGDTFTLSERVYVEKQRVKN